MILWILGDINTCLILNTNKEQSFVGSRYTSKISKFFTRHIIYPEEFLL